jgi:hypothetical protein
MKMFNTLTYAKRLEDAGIPRPQAEAQVQVLAEIVETELATKNDIQHALKELEYRLIIKLSAIMGTMFTVLGIITTIFRAKS